MRELTTAQIEHVSAAGGAPATVANATGVGIIAGSIGAIAAGVAMGTDL